MLWSIRIIDTATFWTLLVAPDCFIVSPLCHAGTASASIERISFMYTSSMMCGSTFKIRFFYVSTFFCISFIYCQAQPQLQLQLRLSLALILISPATLPANHPPTEKVFFSNVKQSYELRWTQMNSDELIWTHMNSDELRWTQMNSDELRWTQKNSHELWWTIMNFDQLRYELRWT